MKIIKLYRRMGEQEVMIRVIDSCIKIVTADHVKSWHNLVTY